MKLRKGFKQLVDEAKARITTIGLEDAKKRLGVVGFGESGDPKGLYAKHGLDPAGIATSVRKFLNR